MGTEGLKSLSPNLYLHHLRLWQRGRKKTFLCVRRSNTTDCMYIPCQDPVVPVGDSEDKEEEALQEQESGKSLDKANLSKS